MRSPWILGVLGALLLAAAPARGEGGAVELVAELDRTACLVGEELTLRVTLKNDRPGPVEVPDPFHAQNWQPTYTLRGPGHPDGTTFSHRSVRRDEFGPPQDDPVLVTLAPGATLEGELPLHEWCPPGAPGAYELTARLVWGGFDVSSAPLRFTVEAPRVSSAVLGPDPGGSQMIWCVWTHASELGGGLFDHVWQHDRDGAEQVVMHGLRAPAGPDARALPVASNFGRGEALFRWRAWREGASLRGAPTPEPHVAERALADDDEVVRPLLMTSDARLDAFVLHAEGGLSLVRFPRPNDDLTVNPPREVWRVPLPSRPPVATCALPHQGADGPRHVLLLRQDERGLVFEALVAAGDAPPVAGPTVREAGARLIAGSQPGLRVDGDGVAEAAVVVAAEGRLVLLTVRLDPEDPHPVARGKDLGELPTDVVDAAVTCDPREGGPEAPWSWAALRAGGQLLHGGAEQDLGGPVARPLQLVRFEWPYVLVVPPGEPPRVVELP